MAALVPIATGVAFVLLGGALIWWAKPVARFVLSFYTTDEPSPNLLAIGMVWILGVMAIVNGLQVIWAALQAG